MKKTSLIILALINVFFISCAEAQENSKNKGNKVSTEVVAKDVSTEEFKSLIAKEGTILDVRTPDEYNNAHIENAVNINIFDANFISQVEQKVDKTKPVYVYCASGGRSTNAMNKMKELGYTNIYNMLGGFSTWLSKGYPSVK